MTSFLSDRASQARPAAPHREMAALIERFTGTDGFHATAIEPLHLFRFCEPNRVFYNSQGPALCLVAQGAKCVTLGEENYFYDPAHFFLVAVDLPLIGQVTHATPDVPYLGLHLNIDPQQVGALLAEMPESVLLSGAPQRGISVGKTDAPLLDASLRMLRLLAAPRHLSVLAPMIVREITYLMLTGDEGRNLRRIAFAGSDAGVMRALSWIKDNFAKPLHIEELARRVHMSASGLHHQFKAVTAMTPLQYQKQLRLQEARRLMLSQSVNAATAGLRVGYESPSQFSREYQRLFGQAPRRDIARLTRSQQTYSPGL